MNMGKRVRDRRKAMRLKQQELADEVTRLREDGRVLSQQALALMETRDSTKSEFVFELAVALKTNVKWLLSGSGNPDRVDHIVIVSDYARYIGESFDQLPPTRQAVIKELFATWNAEAAAPGEEEKPQSLPPSAASGKGHAKKAADV